MRPEYIAGALVALLGGSSWVWNRFYRNDYRNDKKYGQEMDAAETQLQHFMQTNTRLQEGDAGSLKLLKKTIEEQINTLKEDAGRRDIRRLNKAKYACVLTNEVENRIKYTTNDPDKKILQNIAYLSRLYPQTQNNNKQCDPNDINANIRLLNTQNNINIPLLDTSFPIAQAETVLKEIAEHNPKQEKKIQKDLSKLRRKVITYVTQHHSTTSLAKQIKENKLRQRPIMRA